MSEQGFGEWREMASAPRNGSRILVAVRASEQGPAEVDVARWAKPDRDGEECWIADDSDPGCRIIYAEGELVSWMPLPTPVPPLRSSPVAASRRPSPAAIGADGTRPAPGDEIGGSGI